jgi:hypothetical protein
MPFRSYTTVKMVITLRSRRAAEELRDKAKKKYGPKLVLRLNGKSLIVKGPGVQDYRIRDWILDRAGA